MKIGSPNRADGKFSKALDKTVLMYYCIINLI